MLVYPARVEYVAFLAQVHIIRGRLALHVMQMQHGNAGPQDCPSPSAFSRDAVFWCSERICARRQRSEARAITQCCI